LTIYCLYLYVAGEVSTAAAAGDDYDDDDDLSLLKWVKRLIVMWDTVTMKRVQ